MNSFQDPHWPTAHSWLTGNSDANASRMLRLLGVPLRSGAITPSRCDLAPQSIRQSLKRYSTYDAFHRCDLRDLKISDLGDIAVADMEVEDAGERIREAVSGMTSDSMASILLGGNNAITAPALLGLPVSPERCGLLTLDAHLDLRDLRYGSINGNPIRRLLEKGVPGRNIVQIGIQSFSNSADYAKVADEAGITMVPVEKIAKDGIQMTIQNALGYLSSQAEALMVDFDIDVLDVAFAPGAPGARPGGLSPGELREAMYLCGRDPKVRLVDIVELDPTGDIEDRTALAAAACLLSFASGVLQRD